MQFANAQQQQSVNNESHSLKEEPTALSLPPSHHTSGSIAAPSRWAHKYLCVRVCVCACMCVYTILSVLGFLKPIFKCARRRVKRRAARVAVCGCLTQLDKCICMHAHRHTPNTHRRV